MEATGEDMREAEGDYGHDHIKRMGQLIKDTAQSAKGILFEDLDKQKFDLYKIAIQLASEYVILAETEREVTRKQAEEKQVL